jgi:hypothetical protein
MTLGRFNFVDLEQFRGIPISNVDELLSVKSFTTFDIYALNIAMQPNYKNIPIFGVHSPTLECTDMSFETSVKGLTTIKNIHM